MSAARCITAALAGALALPALAQKSTADGIAEYRKMLEDGNPAELFEAKGQALWSEARGPLKATLLRCDLAWFRALDRVSKTPQKSAPLLSLALGLGLITN